MYNFIVIIAFNSRTSVNIQDLNKIESHFLFVLRLNINIESLNEAYNGYGLKVRTLSKAIDISYVYKNLLKSFQTYVLLVIDEGFISSFVNYFTLARFFRMATFVVGFDVFEDGNYIEAHVSIIQIAKAFGITQDYDSFVYMKAKLLAIIRQAISKICKL